jgi:hypothetical protein
MKRLIIALAALLILAACDYDPVRIFPDNQQHIIKCAFGYPGEDCKDLK